MTLQVSRGEESPVDSISSSLGDRSFALLSYGCPPVLGGVETLLASQARWLERYGGDVSVFVGNGNQFSNSIPVESLPYLKSDYKSSLSDPGKPVGYKCSEFEDGKDRIKRRLLKKLEPFNTWIVHNMLSMPFNMVATAALYDLIRENDKQVFGWVHDVGWLDATYETPDRYPWNLLKEPAEVTAYVAISEHRKRQLAKLYDTTSHPPLRVVHDAVELDEILSLDRTMTSFYYRHEFYRDDIIAVYPARMVRRKNFEKALRITRHLKRKNNKIHLVITGPLDPHNRESYRYRDELFELTAELGLEEDVIFCCREMDPVQGGSLEMTFDRVKQLYRMSDMLLMTSRQEGFGMPLLEAGLTGTIICCSDREPLPEIAGNHAIYFDLDQDDEVIASDIDRRIRREVSVQSRRRVRQTFSWPAIMDKCVLPLFREFSLPGSETTQRTVI